MAPVRPRHRSSPRWSVLTATALLALAALSPRAPAQGIDLFDDSVVRDVRITFDDPLWYQQLLLDYCINDPNEPGATEFLSATVELAGYCFEDAQVRARGQSTFYLSVAQALGVGYPTILSCSYTPEQLPSGPVRVPLEIELGDDKPFGVDTLRLNVAYHDSGMLQEVLACKLMREILPGQRANWLGVEVRGPGQAEYDDLGLYVQLEHLDRQLMQRIHWLGQGLRYDRARFDSYTYGFGEYLPPNCATLEDLYRANPAAPGDCDLADYTLILDALAVINQPPPQPSFYTALGSSLDVDQHTRFLAAWCLMHFSDGAQGELFEDGWHGTLTALPQGFDNNPLSSGTTLLDLEDLDFGVNQLLTAQSFRRHYLAHLRRIAGDLLSDPALEDWVLDRAQLIAPHLPAEHDPDWAQIIDFLGMPAALAMAETTMQAEAASLLTTLDALRADILEDPLLADSPPVIESVGPGSLRVFAGQDIVVAAHVEDAQKVYLHWHDRGPYQRQGMVDNGLFPDMLAGDGIYATMLSIPADLDPGWIEYYVEAVRAEPGGHVAAFAPPGGGQQPYVLDVSADWTSNPVRFNEFLAANKRTDVNPCHGTDDDWFELYNPGPGSYDLAGWEVQLGHLDGSPSEAWTIPPSPLAQLGPGEFLRIWCHPYEPGDPGDKVAPKGQTPTPCKALEASFEISRKGGQSLALSNPYGLVDLVRFKRQTRDISQGRWPDGSANWRHFTNPTGGFPNLESIYDLNGDGVVDAADGQAFIDDWYGTVCDPCDGCFADFDGDGVVSIDDFLLLIGQI